MQAVYGEDNHQYQNFKHPLNIVLNIGRYPIFCMLLIWYGWIYRGWAWCNTKLRRKVDKQLI